MWQLFCCYRELRQPVPCKGTTKATPWGRKKTMFADPWFNFSSPNPFFKSEKMVKTLRTALSPYSLWFCRRTRNLSHPVWIKGRLVPPLNCRLNSQESVPVSFDPKFSFLLFNLVFYLFKPILRCPLSSLYCITLLLSLNQFGNLF